MRRRHALSKGGMRRVLVGAVLLVAVGAAGCTSARNALGPSESPCFRAIPLARAAVNDKGKFSGVRYVTARDFNAAIRQAKVAAHGRVNLPVALVEVKGPICAVAYRGTYDPNRVAHGWSPTGKSGTLAIVVVRLQKPDVVATVILRRSPLRLAKEFPPLI